MNFSVSCVYYPQFSPCYIVNPQLVIYSPYPAPVEQPTFEYKPTFDFQPVDQCPTSDDSKPAPSASKEVVPKIEEAPVG